VAPCRVYKKELFSVMKATAPSMTNLEPLTSAIDAYKLFDRREPGWIKVELLPAA
jgi:threonine dehydrogenase-like Zn-dependent dehydrogenase